MNKRNFLLMFITFIFIISNILALTPPKIFYPNSTGIRINLGTEINWSESIGSGEIVKYNLFYSNNSGINWNTLILNSGYINYLNNSNSNENITFSGNENQTIYIDIPKYSNITKAKLNLTGYGFISEPFVKIYDSLVDEPESDGSATSSYQAISFGRVVTNYPGTEIYLLINNSPNVNADKVEILLGPDSNNPHLKDIVYNVNIAEANDYLTGDPSDDNTTAYTRVKTNFACSEEWGDIGNVYRNISFDNTYQLNSSKRYILWFEYVSGSTDGGGYTLEFDADAGVSHNYTGVMNGLANTSYPRIPGIRFYNGTRRDISNIWLETGNQDGNYEWNQTGDFLTTNTTDDFNSSLQFYLDNNCSSELWENCTVPLILHSDTIGKIGISAIDIEFTDYWWNTSSLNELNTYLVNITPTNSSSNGTSVISGNNFTITHQNPNTTLELPLDNYSNSSSSPVDVFFNCSATDDFGLANISLYITDNQNSNFKLNQSAIVSGNNSANWTLGLNNGNYTWNCLSYDNVSNFDWGENRSIIINYSAPVTEAETPSTSSGGSSPKRKIDFDVKIIKLDSPLKPKDFFEFTYFVKLIGTINGDVIMGFWLEKDNQTITSGSDTIYFSKDEEKTETLRIFLPSNALNGTYTFYVKANYEEYSAQSYRTTEVIYPKSELNEVFSSGKYFWKNNKIYLLIGLGVLILIGGIILLIFYLKKKLKKKKDKNRLSSMIKLSVYSSDGHQIGKIKEIYLKKNRVSKWLIKLDKKIKKKRNKKQILIKHKNVESMNEIMIIDKKINDFLNK